MHFIVVSVLTDIEVIARGNGIKSNSFLKRKYGIGNWRKLKGIASVRLNGGEVRTAELHWYEAHGVGKRDMKIKRFLD